jgi:hypothetical protein
MAKSTREIRIAKTLCHIHEIMCHDFPDNEEKLGLIWDAVDRVAYYRRIECAEGVYVEVLDKH